MVTESKPLSPLTANMAAVETLRPGFLGIGYRDDADGKRVVVDSIVPGGPALTTSLRVGDKITSVGDWTLRHPSEFRSSAALAVPGSVISLNVERAAEKKLIRLSVAGAPLPPRPPSFGGMVPSLRLTPYPGTEALPVHGMGQPIVLFFWATHCAPCKAAIPALTQWARSRGVEVIAITGEDREAVKTYLSKRKSPFPFPIGLDTYGEAARLFIIDQSPVFVVIDPSGRFTEEHRGFLKTLPLRWPQRTERP